MRLSQIVFIISAVSMFGALWVMFLQIVPRDAFAWGFVFFSSLLMFFSGAVSTVRNERA
jgi:hypothetical protein